MNLPNRVGSFGRRRGSRSTGQREALATHAHFGNEPASTNDFPFLERPGPTSVGLWLELVIIMTDTAAESARLMNVIDAMLAELDRQGLTEVMANLGFDCTALAKAVIDAADGDVVQFPGGTRGR
jgi:hypothetical protein